MTLKLLNLTGMHFTEDIIEFLSYGKSFTPSVFSNVAALNYDLLEACRTIRFKQFFNNNNIQSANTRSNFIEYIKTNNDPSISTNKEFENDMSLLERNVFIHNNSFSPHVLYQ